MAKKAFVSLTGGLNNVDRPDTLEEDQLQECVNYEITGVGKLEKRTDPFEYSAALTRELNERFTEVLFVSEPYYPPNKLKGDYGDFMLFVYGIKLDSTEYTLEIALPKIKVVSSRSRQATQTYMQWFFESKTGDSFLQDLYDAGLEYTAESEIDISIGERNAYISDGVNPIHKITITNRGELVASFAGLKAPKNKPRISLEELNQQYDSKDSSINYTSDVTGATLGSIGMIQVQYTVVMATGEESNPSPMSDWANGQFFKIAEDGVSDERLIKSITVYDLNIPNIPTNLQKDLKYFKIYYRIVRYSEGVELDSMEFSSQEEIKVKTTEAVNTDNSYTITAVKSVGETISYENDAGLPCKVSAVNAGIVMVGGVTKKASIPANFQYMTPITIRNKNNENYVDAVVQIEINSNDITDDVGTVLFDHWGYYFKKGDATYTSGSKGIDWQKPGESVDQDYYSRHLRIYDTDMTTPIMVFVPFPHEGAISGSSALTIYVKIPLLIAATDHTVYFCWNKIKYNVSDELVDGNRSLRSGHTGVEDDYNDISQTIGVDPAENVTYKSVAGEDIKIEESFTWENNIGIHYGRWCLSSDLVNVAQARQQVFSPRRVPSGSTEILTAPNIDDLGLGDSENNLYDLPNRANLNNNGEATSIDDPLIVQNSVHPPTGSPFSVDPAKFEDGDLLPEGRAVGDDKVYRFGGVWTPTSDVETVNHDADHNTEHASSNSEHYGAPPHNAQYTSEDKSLGRIPEGSEVGDYYIKYEGHTLNEEQTGYIPLEDPQAHTHEKAGADGEWVADEAHPIETIQIYKYNTPYTDSGDNIIGTTKGMSPIAALDSTGNNLDDYSLLNNQAWTTFPPNLNKVYRIPGILNQPLPVFQQTAPTVKAEYNETGGLEPGTTYTRQAYHSIGAFKPWCGGWSFRKQALSMGNMPDKGYFYTTLTFRKADLAMSGDTESEYGIAPGGTTWSSYRNVAPNNNLNTIFYISCGAINDVDAMPNHPVEFTKDHYDSQSELGASDVTTNAVYAKNVSVTQDDLQLDSGQGGFGRDNILPTNFLPRTPGYNRDNFKAVSTTGLSPGDLEDVGKAIQDDGTGLPKFSAGAFSDLYYTHHGDQFGAEDEQDPELDQDPKRNLIVVRLNRQAFTNSPDGHLSLKLDIAGQEARFLGNLSIEPLKFIDVQTYVSLFVYFSWDLIEEKAALGWSLVDDENAISSGSTFDDFSKASNNHYGSLSLAEFDFSSSINQVDDFKERFKNKALYDVGLGNSTYINRVVTGVSPNAEEFYQKVTQSGYHGFYGSTELTVGDYITNKNQILSMRNGTPRYENPVGVNWEDYSQNNNISFAATKERVDKVYDNMIMWSELGNDGFPDLNYKLLKEPVVKIFAAPSFLKFEYSNTFVIWTRNTINRFILKGTATGWAGSSESLIEEQLQYGLFAPKSLVKVGADMVWFSEEGVIRWSPDGMMNISQNVIDIPLNGDYIGFYCPNRNQYILHDNSTYISYAYHMTYRMWTTFSGLNIISASTLTRGVQAENFNLLLKSEGNLLQQYPGEDYTGENARIKTMDLFMDSGQIKRVKVDYRGGTDANLIYNLAYNDKDSNNVERNNTITAIEKNTWRGLGDLGQQYGRVASFELENADEIATIIYDAVTRGSE